MIVFCLFSTTRLAAQTDPLAKRVTAGFSQEALRNVLEKLSLENKLAISFDADQPGMDTAIDMVFQNALLADILRAVLNKAGMSWQYLNQTIVVLPAKKSCTVSGQVIDAATGEDLIGAQIYIVQTQQRIYSNNYGFYSLTLPEGNYDLWVSYLGYHIKKFSFTLNQIAVSRHLALETLVNELKEVSITTKRSEGLFSAMETGESGQWDSFRDQPFFKGEADVVKLLQMQNGITGISEGSSSMFIWGGNKDQNLILLDEAIVYNPSHLFGLTSVFNPDAVKSVRLYKADFPAYYGGRLSSVIDARMADGSEKDVRVNGGLSLLSGRLSIEGPIVKERGSFLVAGRKSLANSLHHDFDLYDLKASYTDLNIKFNYKISRADRLFLSGYLGGDRVHSSNGYLNKWGNQTSTFRWNHLFSPRLFSNLSAIYSNYRNVLNINADTSSGLDRWTTGIRDWTFKGDFTYFCKPENQIQFGFSSIYHRFIPGETTDSAYNNISRARALEAAAYFSHRITAGAHVRFCYGLRFSLFNNFPREGLFQEPEKAKFANLEPRLMLQYKLSEKSLLQWSYDRNYQYLQLLQNDELGFSSLETWIPSGKRIPPQYADLFSMQYKKSDQPYAFGIGLYYKYMANQIQLIDHAQLISNPFIEDQLHVGRSDAYGLECSYTRKFGKLSFNGYYTYARAMRTIEEVNHGTTYAANYDIPHALKLSLGYPLSSSLQVNSYFTFTSGRTATLPVGYFEQQGLRIPIYDGRNLERMPGYHRLDLNLRYVLPVPIHKDKPWIHTFSVGLYNIYNRKNPLLYKINPIAGNNDPVEEQLFSGTSLMLNYSFSF